MRQTRRDNAGTPSVFARYKQDVPPTLQFTSRENQIPVCLSRGETRRAEANIAGFLGSKIGTIGGSKKRAACGRIVVERTRAPATCKGSYMPLQSMLVRLRTVEIFGTLLPGLFVLASVGITRLLMRARDWTGVENHVAAFLNSEPGWISVAGFVVASYLCGSLIRVLPVRIVDDLVGRILRPLFQLPYLPKRVQALYRGHFPYHEMLRSVHAELCESGYLDDLIKNRRPETSSLREGIEAPSFDYWKAFVAGRNPGLASRNEAAESRTRFFHGMFWATVFALGISLWARLAASTNLPLAWSALSISLSIILAVRYRFVTGEEVLEVYISFLIQSCIDRREEGKLNATTDFSAPGNTTNSTTPSTDRGQRSTRGISAKAAQPAVAADDPAAGTSE